MRFSENPFSYALDVGQVRADADIQLVEIVETTRKGPFFGTPLEIGVLTLPKMALGHGTAIVRSRLIFIKVNEIGAPSRENGIGESLLQLIGIVAVDLRQVIVNL